MKTKLYQDVEEVVLALKNAVEILYEVWHLHPDDDSPYLRKEVGRVFKMWGRHPKNWEGPYNTIIDRVKEIEEAAYQARGIIEDRDKEITELRKQPRMKIENSSSDIKQAFTPAGDEEGLLSRVEELEGCSQDTIDRYEAQVKSLLADRDALFREIRDLKATIRDVEKRYGLVLSPVEGETGSLYDSGFGIGQTIRLNAQISDSMLRGIADGVEPGDMDAESMAKRRRER